MNVFMLVVPFVSVVVLFVVFYRALTSRDPFEAPARELNLVLLIAVGLACAVTALLAAVEGHTWFALVFSVLALLVWTIPRRMRRAKAHAAAGRSGSDGRFLRGGVAGRLLSRSAKTVGVDEQQLWQLTQKIRDGAPPQSAAEADALRRLVTTRRRQNQLGRRLSPLVLVAAVAGCAAAVAAGAETLAVLLSAVALGSLFMTAVALGTSRQEKERLDRMEQLLGAAGPLGTGTSRDDHPPDGRG